MKKIWLNFTVDVGMFVLMSGMALIGFILKFVLPPGSGGHGRQGARLFLGLSRHDWGDLHFYLALLFLVLLVVHLVLHWSWIRCRVTELARALRGSSVSPG